MHPQQIVVADYLDILFHERNKEYGAYVLRKEYAKRLRAAMLSTAAVVTCALTLYYLGVPQVPASAVHKPDVTVTLVDQPKPDEPETPLPPPPPPPPQPVATVKNLIPVIVQDQLVKPEDMPPAVEEIEDAKIGNITQTGIEDGEITAPPLDQQNGVIEVPRRGGDDGTDSIFRKVEIESSYPGGPNAWKRYLLKTFVYPQKAQEEFIQGAVVVKFIVATDGNVSGVEAVSGPEELRAEAVRVISKSGKWTPAIQNGRNVKSYKLQAIHFRLE
jgi:periplasmic protein TonB